MRMRTLLQIIVVSILSLGSHTSLGVSHDAPAPASDTFGPQAVIRPLEVRTRRLHMVRPDLLRYPIQYDTYC